MKTIFILLLSIALQADEILQEYSKKHMVDDDDLEETLATDWNCVKCFSCGKFFGEGEICKNYKLKN